MNAQACSTLVVVALLLSFMIGMSACNQQVRSQDCSGFLSDEQLYSCEHECDQLLTWQVQAESLQCRHHYQQCQNTTDPAMCLVDFAQCFAKAINERDNQYQQYNRCMESLPRSTAGTKHKGQRSAPSVKKKPPDHKPEDSFEKRFRQCDREVNRCQDKVCRHERKRCLKTAEKLHKDWIRSLKDQLAFCESMFPNEPANQEACIIGVLDNSQKPPVTHGSCWQDSFSCSQECTHGFNACLFE